MNKFFVLFLIVLTTGCAPKIKTTVLSPSRSNRPIRFDQPFAVIEKDTVDFSSEQLLGTVEIKDNGLSIHCQYEKVMAKAKQEALKMGGNCLVLTKHVAPNVWSSCDHIKANIYAIKNPRKYELKIFWSPDRKLAIADFKGSVENRPFLAATGSGFEFKIKLHGIAGRYKIEGFTYFDCKASYFKRSKQDSVTLVHEQVHFDISELYARKFIMRMQQEADNFRKAMAIHQQVMEDITREMQVKQDEYDAEIYPDRSKQSKWSTWIKEELEKTKALADKRLTSPKTR